jgi:hypothetical protein
MKRLQVIEIVVAGQALLIECSNFKCRNITFDYSELSGIEDIKVVSEGTCTRIHVWIEAGRIEISAGHPSIFAERRPLLMLSS